MSQMITFVDKRVGEGQSVLTWLKLELALSKKLKLGWLGSARRQSQNQSLAQLRLEQVLNFQAELGSGSEKMEISEMSSARARGK